MAARWRGKPSPSTWDLSLTLRYENACTPYVYKDSERIQQLILQLVDVITAYTSVASAWRIASRAAGLAINRAMVSTSLSTFSSFVMVRWTGIPRL